MAIGQAPRFHVPEAIRRESSSLVRTYWTTFLPRLVLQSVPGTASAAMTSSRRMGEGPDSMLMVFSEGSSIREVSDE